MVDQPCILQWNFLISCVSWGFVFSVTVEESPSFATLPRARLAYVGPAPERSHSLTDLSEAPLYRAGVFGLHGTSLDRRPLEQDRTSAGVYLPGLFLHCPQRNIPSVSKPLKTFSCCCFFVCFFLLFACASRILMSPPTLLNITGITGRHHMFGMLFYKICLLISQDQLSSRGWSPSNQQHPTSLFVRVSWSDFFIWIFFL